MSKVASAPAASPVPSGSAGGEVADFIRHRLERALRQRMRYRYVRPRVVREGECLRVESPCCSRNVDAGGGVIDIALLEHRAGTGWRLCARDHASASWVPKFEHEKLEELLHLLCVDSERQFWP